MAGSSDNLTRVGIPPEPAKILGDTFGATALTGTTQGTAAVLVGSASTVTAASGQTGGILINHNQGRSQEIYNTSAVAATIYPPVGGSINGLAVNTGVSVPANKSAVFRCIANVGGISNYSAIVSA